MVGACSRPQALTGPRSKCAAGEPDELRHGLGTSCQSARGQRDAAVSTKRGGSVSMRALGCAHDGSLALFSNSLPRRLSSGWTRTKLSCCSIRSESFPSGPPVLSHTHDGMQVTVLSAAKALQDTALVQSQRNYDTAAAKLKALVRAAHWVARRRATSEFWFAGWRSKRGVRR